MFDPASTENLHAATPTTRGARRVAACTRALARYVVLGAVALSILPAQAFAAALPLLLAARAQEDATGGKPAKPPVEIKPNPFRELLVKAKRLKDEGEIDFGRTIELSFEADLTEAGSLANVTPISAKPDTPRLRELGEDLVRALSETNVPGSLKGFRHLRVSLRLDQRTFAASLDADAESDERAARTAHGYALFLKMAHLNAIERRPELVPVYKGMTFSSSGKQLAFRLEMSREAAGNLLLKQITPN